MSLDMEIDDSSVSVARAKALAAAHEIFKTPHMPPEIIESLIKSTEIKTMPKSDKLSSDILSALEKRAGLKPKSAIKPKSEPKTKPKDEWAEVVTLIPEGTKAFSDIFGWTPEHGDFPVKIFSGYDTPEIIEYIWPREETETFARAIENGWKPRLVGAPGTGKTELPSQYAAVTGRPFLRINFNVALEPEDILGSMGIVGGETVYEYGDLAKAMDTPAIVLFDEYSRVTAAMGMILQRFLEKKELCLPQKRDGENILIPHAALSVCAADNTLGLGDDLDKYGSANVQDVSSLNRWEVCIPLGYASKETEIKIMKNAAPTLPSGVAEKLAQFSAMCHAGFIKGELALPFSPRNLKVIAKLTCDLKDPKAAIKMNYLNALDEDSRGACEGLIRTVWGS
jgi:hypothetical protein